MCVWLRRIAEEKEVLPACLVARWRGWFRSGRQIGRLDRGNENTLLLSRAVYGDFALLIELIVYFLH